MRLAVHAAEVERLKDVVRVAAVPGRVQDIKTMTGFGIMKSVRVVAEAEQI